MNDKIVADCKEIIKDLEEKIDEEKKVNAKLTEKVSTLSKGKTLHHLSYDLFTTFDNNSSFSYFESFIW